MTIITQYQTALKAEGKSDNTIRNYTCAINQFLKEHNNNIKTITQETIDIFFANFNARNQTQNLKKNAINSFLKFLYNRKHINNQYEIKFKSIRQSEPEYLTQIEQDKLFNTLQSSPLFYRDYVLFITMLYTGMRISEVVNIKLKDIQEDHITIKESKTGAGKIYIREKLFPILEDYLTSLPFQLKQNDYIFQSKQNNNLSIRMVQTALQKYLKLANIKKEITPHSLRHTFAARLRQSGSDIEIIQRTLRHKHIQSSQRYSHIQDKQLKDAVEKSVRIPNKNIRG